MVALTAPTDVCNDVEHRFIEPARTVLAALLLLGLAGASYAQGGFYPAGQRFLTVLVGVAGILALAISHSRVGTFSFGWQHWYTAPVVLVFWIALDAAGHQGLGSSLRWLGLLTGATVVLGCARQLGPASARLLLDGLGALAAVIALLGWWGVAAHHQPLALVGQGLYRASSTLSYPNATGALLAVIALVTLASAASTDRVGRFRTDTGLVTVLSTGLVATMSRGALVAAAAGAVVLLAALGWRRMLGTAAYPLAGVAIASAGLLSSAATDQPARPLVAIGALLAGVLVGAWNRRGRWLAWPYLGLAAGAVVVALTRPFPAVGQARLNLRSDDRWAALHAVWQLIQAHPVIGAGPGLAQLSWSSPTTGVHVFSYAHDEYLQTWAELGLVGLLLVLVSLGGLVGYVFRRRAGNPALSTAALAAIGVVAVSSACDFSAHFPALVLTAAAVVGCAGSGHPTRQSHENPYLERKK